ncbi:MAG: C4-type zinc ribbon domain-containing protein [Rikenellaceae bacterium]
MTTAIKKDSSEYTVEERIEALYNLQKVDSKIDEINRIKGELPFEVEDLSSEIEGLEQRVKRIMTDIEDTTRSSKAQKEKIEQSKALISRYEEQQNEVHNNREYESLSKEIEYQKLEIELCEKNIKEFSSQNRQNKKNLEEAKSILTERKADLVHKKAELSVIEAETADEISQLEKDSQTYSEKVDERTLVAYGKIRASMRNGIAVAVIQRDACSGCFNRIPPQRQLDIRMSKKIIVCEYCGRILVSDLLEDNQQQD